MKQLLIILLLAIPCAAQLPKDLYSAPHRLNHDKYSVVEFKGTVFLYGSFLDDIFHGDVRQRIVWKYTLVVIDNNPVASWNGKLLNVPGCVGTQQNNPQQEFYFEDRSLEGMTIRGKAGMAIQYRCMAFAIKETK